MSAATRVLATQGPGAPTATIAKEAGVSNGSLFNYFETKADLLNELFLQLKAEMAAAALDRLPKEGDTRKQLQHVWTHWLRWATSCPEKRRAIAHLQVSKEITVDTHRKAGQTMAPIAEIVERSRKGGPMSEAPLGFVVSLMSAIADATMDYMIREPANAKRHAKSAFDALWRLVA